MMITRPRTLSVIITSFALAAAACVGSHAASPPPSQRTPVADNYHGTTVTDQYRWLED